MPAREPRDPLDAALRPPFDESPEEKQERLAKEAEALRISHEIDEEIKKEKSQRKKRQIVRLLLLGQSESEFQRLYTPTAFREERVLWRSVIQLNIVRSIRTILDAVQDVRRRELPVSSASEETEDEGSDDRVRLPLHLETLAMRLLPLRHIEALLVAKLVPPNEDEATHLGHSSPDSDGFHYNHEIFVRPGGTWKGGMLAKARLFGRPQSAGTTGQETQDESQVVLDQCRDDIVTLWKDKTVKDILRKRKIRLEESPGL
ncbi:hypothetical protein EW026_g1865 [Hermanssonia centrifuga]|uniref:Uncharacterized protein n=1 Tax=Hermanssonia centrifuga TaxID=98765 RepID=A0A4S4KQ45_9APHY|nr:hypothetical protein EW026_g1865 [Hermanssonia centrifuga]